MRRLLPNEKIKLVPDDKIRRVVLCSGKVYYDLYEEREKRGIDDVYLLRVEQLYPFPTKALVAELSRFKQAEMVWCQEEPRNMGAWFFVDAFLEWVLNQIGAKHQQRALCRPSGLGLDRGRPDVEASGAAQAVPRRGAGLRRDRAGAMQGVNHDRHPRAHARRIGHRSDHRQWFKKPGDAVAVDEPLVELETDKVTIEVPAPAAGVLAEIAAKDGETVARRRAARPDQGWRRRAPRPRPPRLPRSPREAPKPRQLRRLPPRRPTMPVAAVGAQDGGRKRRRPRRRSPAPARHGRVTKGDMMAAIERAAAAPTPVAATAGASADARAVAAPTMPRAKSACT